MITNADQDTLANFLSSVQSYNMDELKSLGLNFDQGLTATADPNMLLMKRASLPLSDEPELTPMQPSTPQDQRVPSNPPGSAIATDSQLPTTSSVVVTKRTCAPTHSLNSPSSTPSAPPNVKKTKGRVKIKMEFINNKLRRYTTFSKRKTGIMKKAYELSTLTGTQVMLLVASETGHVYTFATRKLQPMITSESGKQLIQTCLNSPDESVTHPGDQRMTATGYEETDLSYNILGPDATTTASSPEDIKPSPSCSPSSLDGTTSDPLMDFDTDLKLPPFFMI
ncbi:serum response factor homolog [Varroa jacobsoni]|uniref:Serum response factor homolog n=1 Tax=Varroa destructor TaxID=109461 RepID=A0A7M7JU60_VARDE|nr:serum response factor homolog [Varroa destructor]XP_022711066.1 serum response factor homolog [Varroa jacobsoni]